MKILTILFICYCLSNIIYHFLVYEHYKKIMDIINDLIDSSIIDEREINKLKIEINKIKKNK